MSDQPPHIDDKNIIEWTADYVAGDLDAEDEAAYAAILKDDDDLQADCNFWADMRKNLHDNGRDPSARPPGPGLASSVQRRLQTTTSKSRNIIPISGWLAAAVAVVLAITVYLPPEPASQEGALVSYSEDGSALVFNQGHGQKHGIEAPRATFISNTTLQPALNQQIHALQQDRGDARPWLGVWTRPVDVSGVMDRHNALLITRVASGSAAAGAGIAPGDVLLDVADCNVSTRWCIAHALKENHRTPPCQSPFTAKVSANRPSP